MGMEPTPEMIREIDRAKIEQARRMRPAQRFYAGAELFEWACDIARSGIRFQNPDASNEEISRMLAERIELGRRWEAGD